MSNMYIIKICFLAMISILVITKVNGQTTWDEYNYGKEGYKYVLEKGLGGKPGYSIDYVLEKQIKFPDDYTIVWLYKMRMVSTGKIASYVLVYQLRDKSHVREYFCIPHPDSKQEILDTYFNSIKVTNCDKYSGYKISSILYCVSQGLSW